MDGTPLPGGVAAGVPPRGLGDSRLMKLYQDEQGLFAHDGARCYRLHYRPAPGHYDLEVIQGDRRRTQNGAFAAAVFGGGAMPLAYLERDLNTCKETIDAMFQEAE